MRSTDRLFVSFPEEQPDILDVYASSVQVAQLAGYVAEHSAYHHGEASLMSTIVGLAQDFCGSNNINVFFPSGQFGTRIMGTHPGVVVIGLVYRREP